MIKIAVAAALGITILAAPAFAASKANWGDCKNKVMASPKYTSSSWHGGACGATCAAAIRRCMANGGNVD